MKAKLIKTDKDNYILVDSTKGVYDKGYLIGSSIECDVNKLSKQNCDDLFGVIDIDPFIIEDSKGRTIDNESYELGFKRAMELNNTKHYTLEDMMNCWNKALTFQNHKESFGHYIQSLQQTEWDVEIEMEINLNGKNGLDRAKMILKLDENGCLILKRI
jgi:hypothetical protein